MTNQNWTIDEMLADYRKNERLLQEMSFDTAELSKQDMTVLTNYIAEKQMLTQTAQSLDAFASMVTVNYGVSKTITSIVPRMEHIQIMKALTNNLDMRFVDTLYLECLHLTPTTYTAKECEKTRAFTKRVVNDLMEDYGYNDAYANMLNAEQMMIAMQPNSGLSVDVTIATLMKTNDKVLNLIEKEGIDITNLFDSAQAVIEKHERENSINTIAEHDVIKEQPELVIVESNDGYVLATNASPELLRAYPKLDREFNERVHNEDEIVHNEAPAQTTIDMAEVGGNVKYEQFDDIGSVEKGQGELTYEEKTERTEKVQSNEKETVKTTRTTKETTEHER